MSIWTKKDEPSSNELRVADNRLLPFSEQYVPKVKVKWPNFWEKHDALFAQNTVAYIRHDLGVFVHKQVGAATWDKIFFDKEHAPALRVLLKKGKDGYWRDFAVCAWKKGGTQFELSYDHRETNVPAVEFKAARSITDSAGNKYNLRAVYTQRKIHEGEMTITRVYSVEGYGTTFSCAVSTDQQYEYVKLRNSRNNKVSDLFAWMPDSIDSTQPANHEFLELAESELRKLIF